MIFFLPGLQPSSALLSPVNTSALGCGVLGVISGEDEKN